MGRWKHRKPEPSDVRGLCVVCNKNQQKKVAGKEKYRAICGSCDSKLYEEYKPLYNYPKLPKGYRHWKKKSCEKCGFIPEHKCQLDVDHIDGNHSNNNPKNLQTLCANCHRLKTWIERQPPKKFSEKSSS